MRRCVIVGGADIGNYDRIKQNLRSDDFFIYCDCGLNHVKGLGHSPDLIIGDFDSYSNFCPRNDSSCSGERDISLPYESETIVLPCEKDDTDTVFAAKEALSRGFDNFLLIGVVGKRLDHTLGNTSILLMLHDANAKAVIIDDYSVMEIASNIPTFIEDSFSFFSLLNIFGPACGINVSNAKYPLGNAEITCDYQYGISNEVMPGETACVRVEIGRLLLIKVF